MYIKKEYFLLLLCLNIHLYSDDLNDLLTDLNQYTDQNNVNIDYKPTTMTVLYAEDLEIFGIATLAEALDVVPGLQTFKTTNYSNIISSRGYTQPYNIFQDKINFKIDGIDVSSNYFELFPMSLVQRIEISRGSASTIYGESGYLAIIDIITKNKNNITVGAGSFNRKDGSFMINEKLTDNWNMKLDGYYIKENKRVDAPSGITTNSVDFGTTFNRKKESLEGKENKAIGVLFQNKDFKISSRYIESLKENGYGLAGYLDFSEEGYTQYRTWVNQISYDTSVSQNNTLETKLSFLQNNYNFNTYLFDLEPNALGIYNPHYKIDYTQEEKSLSFLVKNKTFENHRIEYGMQASVRSIGKNDYYANVDNLYKVGLYVPTFDAYFPQQRELIKFSGDKGFLNNTESKKKFSYFFNDRYSFSKDLSFVLNFSLDDYESKKKQLNYKVGTVYTNDDVNIYKAVFSQTNRNPSMIESSLNTHFIISGNDKLKAERMQNAELMYIYQQHDQKLKLNFFYTKYKNSIDLRKLDNNILEFYNKDKDDYSYGIEIEYTKNFENRSKILLSASRDIFNYNDEAKDSTIDTPIVSKDRVNLGYIYPWNSKVTLSSLAKYYGEKKLLDSSGSIDSVVLFDLGTQYRIAKDLKISYSIKNIFDKEYFYWGNNTTDEKMLREGRTFYASISYDF
jgi:iron complex outermembrane receptor protein